MRRTPFEPGACYHVFGRGVDHQPIFFLAANWTFFLARLRRYATPDLAAVIAYCLMPNHYHLALRAHSTDLGSAVMAPLLNSYAKAVNHQERCSGPLFSGTYRARRVRDEERLVQLSAYIHLNPVQAGLVSTPEDWAFSSYRDYVGLRAGSLPDSGAVLERAGSRETYRQYVADYIGDRQQAGYLLLD